MCKIFGAIKAPGKNEELTQLLDIQRDDLAKERDGIGAIIIDRAGKVTVHRSMTDYDGVIDKVIKSMNSAVFFAVHTRTSTGGSKDLSNVHFFEHEGYALAHNGFVSGYTARYYQPMGFQSSTDYFHGTKGGFFNDVKNKKFDVHNEGIEDAEYFTPEEIKEMERLAEIDPDLPPPSAKNLSITTSELQEMETCHGCNTSNKKVCKRHAKVISKAKRIDAMFNLKKEEAEDNPCDTLQFLRGLEKPVTRGSFAWAMTQKELSGFAILVDKENKKVYVGTRRSGCYMTTDAKSFGAFSSYKPDIEVEYSNWARVAGLEFYTGKEKVKLDLTPRELVQGTFEIDPLVEAQNFPIMNKVEESKPTKAKNDKALELANK